MSPRIVKTLLFVLLLFFGDRLGAIWLDNIVLDSQFRYSRLYRGDCEADVIICGNSRGVAGFYAPAIEERFGVECLNLAYNGMSPPISRAIVEDYLDHNKAPQLVIVEATCVDSQVGDILSLKPFWKHSERLMGIARKEHATAAQATKVSHLFAYNCELFFRVLHFKNKSDQTWIRRNRISEALVAETNRMEPLQLDLPSEEDLGELSAIISLCKLRGIECKLVVAPYLPAFKDKIQNWDEWKAAFSEHATAEPISLVDLSSSVNDPEFFGDRIHPNFASRHAIIEAAVEQGVFDSVAAKTK